MYRHMGAGPMTIYRGPPKPADKPTSEEQQQQEENGATWLGAGSVLNLLALCFARLCRLLQGGWL
jgi:hypothetical protein